MTMDTSDIIWNGDFSQDLKNKIIHYSDFFTRGEGFAPSVARRLKLKEATIYRREQDGKTHCKVTFELTVDKDMVNMAGTLHGGYSIALIDVCSSITLMVLGLHAGKPKPFNLVSQALNTTFHAPAPLGVKIEMVNATVSFGARTVSAVTEIWDITNARLCMTAVHTKMAPSESKL